jgi:hypothetical protein
MILTLNTIKILQIKLLNKNINITNVKNRTVFLNECKLWLRLILKYFIENYESF